MHAWIGLIRVNKRGPRCRDAGITEELETMTADDLAPYVPKSSVAMVLVICNKRALVFPRGGLQLAG